MIKIDEAKIRNLLIKRKKFIKTRKFPIDSLFAFIALLVAVFTADFSKINIVFAWIFKIATIVYLFYIVYLIIMFFIESYSPEKLYNEIIEQSERKHTFSLLVIKDNSEKYFGKYLLKYDKRWKCYLLPYNATKTNDDEEFVESVINRFTGLQCEIQEPQKIEQTKFSFSDGYEKTYTHLYYGINISVKDSILPDSYSFKIGKDKYKWFSIQEMKENPKIMERNSEIVKYISENF